MKPAFLLIACLPVLALAAEPPAADPDPELTEFSNYLHTASYLEGLFQGIHDFCKPKVSQNVYDSSLERWNANNGVYLAAVDTAIARFVAERIAPEEAERVTRALEAQNAATIQKTRDDNKILRSIKDARVTSMACSHNLGVLGSRSFYFKNISPSAHTYWEENLKP